MKPIILDRQRTADGRIVHAGLGAAVLGRIAHRYVLGRVCVQVHEEPHVRIGVRPAKGVAVQRGHGSGGITAVIVILFTLNVGKVFGQATGRIMDTTVLVKIIDPDNTVIFARPRDSALFCHNLMIEWNKYLELNKDVKDQLYKTKARSQLTSLV